MCVVIMISLLNYWLQISWLLNWDQYELLKVANTVKDKIYYM